MLQTERVYFQALRELILRSRLELHDKSDLICIFSLCKDSELKSLVGLCEEDPSWIEKINDNYKGKSAAIAAGSSVAWEKIIEDEERQLRQFEV
ncbi:MAG: hypothetical protein Q7S34_02565 [bacterium]|nr:hypothetical protein [bacterium]